MICWDATVVGWPHRSSDRAMFTSARVAWGLAPDEYPASSIRERITPPRRGARFHTARNSLPVAGNKYRTAVLALNGTLVAIRHDLDRAGIMPSLIGRDYL